MTFLEANMDKPLQMTDLNPDILAQINTFYRKLRPLVVDLVGDYAGKDLFFIEGDSLLLQILSLDRIDKSLFLDYDREKRILLTGCRSFLNSTCNLRS